MREKIFDSGGNERFTGEFARGELDALIAEGEASGKPIDGEKFLAEWRALRSAVEASGKRNLKPVLKKRT